MSFSALFILRAIAPRFGLVDLPSARKIHTQETPLVGGIAIYMATFFACLLIFPLDSNLLQLFLISCGLIVILGGLDDQRDLGVPIRLVAQCLITSILVFYAGTYIHFLGDIVALGNIDLGLWGIVFTFVATLSLINAFNWVDGIDGLAGGLALTTFASLAILFELKGVSELRELPLILSVSLVPFLLFNLGIVPGRIRKIFMGDAGSMFIGLGIIWLFVLGTQGEQPSFRPVTAVWVTAIPLWDLTLTVYKRLKAGLSPFQAGKDHFHHLLLALGLNQYQVLFVVLFISFLMCMAGVLGEFYLVPEHIMLAIYVILFFVYSSALSVFWRKVKLQR